MGGTLYLNNGQKPNRSNICVSGYQRGKENFALSTFDDNNGKGYTFNDPHLGNVKFPTSEHYLHFQKLTPSAKQAQLQAWQNQPSPGVILKGIRDSKSPFYIANNNHAYMTGGQFNKQWDTDKIAVQMQINASKYAQNADFKKAIDRAEELGNTLGDGKGPVTIIEDTSSLASGPKPEEEWGTGPGGTGNNILGNSQTAFAMIANKNNLGQAPSLQSFKTKTIDSYYSQAQTQYQSQFQPTLKSVRQKSGQSSGLGQPDTSDLGGGLIQKVTISQGQINNQTFGSTAAKTFSAPQNSSAAPMRQNVSTATSSKDRALGALKKKFNAQELSVVQTNTNTQGIQVTFANKKQADNFILATGHSQLKQSGKLFHVIADASKVQKILDNLGVGKHGRTNPVDITKAIIYDAPKPTFSNNNNNQATSTQRVANALNKNNFPATQISIADDTHVKNQKVVKIQFNDPQAAAKFARFAGGAPVNGNEVILGPLRAQQVFKNLNIEKHGRANPHNMYDSLVFDAGQKPKSQASNNNLANDNLRDSEGELFKKVFSNIAGASAKDPVKEDLANVFTQFKKDINADRESDSVDEQAHVRLNEVAQKYSLKPQEVKALHEMVNTIKKEVVSNNNQRQYQI